MNFKIYDEINDLMNRLKQEILIMKDSPQSKKIPFSEVIIVIDNSNIKEQIEIIKKNMDDDEEVITSVYTPFIIFLSRQSLDLTDFPDIKKIYHFQISLNDVITYLKSQNEIQLDEHKILQIQGFLRKINVL